MLLCSKMGCFFAINAFDNGVRWVRALKCLFLQCFGCFGGGGGRDHLFSRARKLSGVFFGAPWRKWGSSRQIVTLYIWHLLLRWIGCATGFFLALCTDAQNCGETAFLTFTVWSLQHEGQNRGFGKGAKIYFWCRTHHDFVWVFWCRASFSRKTVLPTSTKVRWNHWKRSAKLARPQNAILAPEGPKWAILVRVTKRSRYICRCTRGACRYIFKKTRTIVWYFLLFPFLTTSHFLSF